MDFSIDRAVEDRLDRFRRALEDEVIPLEPLLASEPWKRLEPALEGARTRVRELGLWAPGQPEELGGLGVGLVELGLISEILGASPLGHYAFGCQAPDAGNAEILHLHGSAEQKEKYLRPLVAGTLRSCFSMTEPDNPGSNPTLLSTRAVRDGDGYVIDGHKWYTTAADGAAFAIVLAVTDPAAPRHRRASLLVVPTDTPGFELVRNLPVMGEAGGGYFSHGEIRYRDCRVPASALLGDEGDGFRIAQERLGPGRIHHCMRWLGICRRAFDLLARRAREREVAPGRRLGDQGIVQAWIAESAAEIRAARLHVLETAWRIERGGFREARTAISLIKFQVAGVLGRVLDRALQVHGGLGMTDDTILAYFFRHERAARIYDGPDEVHKIAAAKALLRELDDEPSDGSRLSSGA